MCIRDSSTYPSPWVRTLFDTAPAFQPPPLVRLSVLDQGRGIPPEDFVRMFDQYEAVHMKEHGKAELGLELAFCRMVAEAHGGHIFAGNNPDRGAVITVEM